MSRTAGRRVRTVFVSDLHLGYKGADIRALNAFLAAHAFDALYLVGDTLDGWKLESRWYWNRDYSEFLDLVLERRRDGALVTLLTGNHDEKLRKLPATRVRSMLRRRFGIGVAERVVHRAHDGRRYLVMHGDQFDGVLVRSTSKLADRAWSWLGESMVVAPARSRWSLGKAIATNANWLIGRFAETALLRAAAEDVDGIVCGHSHVAELRRQDGLTLANCGSWTGVEAEGARHSAVVETLAGELELIDWPTMRRPHGDPGMACLPPERPGATRADAAQLVRLVHALWPSPSPTLPRALPQPLSASRP
jgi:UDP-2,3-diacylglucosamine pyrophosphatase LpxH